MAGCTSKSYEACMAYLNWAQTATMNSKNVSTSMGTTTLVPALWKHKTRPTQFALIVDNFGIKYFTKNDLDHLSNSLKKYYDVKVDLDGKE
jgi:hypothetical protein